MKPAPPLFAERLLAAVVHDREWRDSIVGDLREEFATMASASGARVARRWYWRQVAGIGLRFVATRLGAPRPSRRTWLASEDIDSATSWRIGLLRDMRHAWRAIASRPGTSAVIVCTLALTLAVNSTVFAILDALVLRPYRFPDVDRVVMVISDSPQQAIPDRESVAPGDFRDWRNEARSVTHLAAAEWWDANLSGIETPQHVAGYRVTADFFDALGVVPVLGRDFVAEEETPGSHRRAVLGYRLWQQSFGGDTNIVGKTIRLDGEPHEVVGVAAPGFAIPDGAEVWAPIAYTPEEWAGRRRGFLTVVGRLAGGHSIDQLRSEINAIVERQRREFPDTNGNRPVMVMDFTSGMADPGAGPFVATVQAAALLLMLIACANIANLLLARGTERAKEYAMRLALGASRGRIVWQTVLEGIVLTSVAVILAVPIGWALTGATRASIPAAVIRFIPGYDYIRLSPALFAALGLAAAVATLLFALMPALYASRVDIQDGLRQGTRTATSSRRRQWVRSALATAQVALTLALLFGSVLAVSATNRAVDGVFGFDKNNLLVGALVLPERAYASAERRRQFIDNVLNRMRTIPAVSNIAMINRLPYGGGNTRCEFWVEGVVRDRRNEDVVDCRRISPDLFTTMRIPVLSGRTFDDDDRRDTLPVAVVSRSLADRYWPAQDAIGRRFKTSDSGEWITVVGVVGDVLHDWFLQRRAPTFYRPLAQDAPFAHWFVARTIGDPTSIATDLRRAVAAADPDQPVSELKSMDDHIVDRTAGLQFIARALTFVAVIAFALAMTGLYSLMVFMASRRTQEIGVRIALGADRWQVIRVATAPALHITIIGVVAGGLLAAGLGQVMESVLRGGIAANLWYLSGLIVLLTTVALTAAYLPARRAAGIDPAIALRTE